MATKKRKELEEKKHNFYINKELDVIRATSVTRKFAEEIGFNAVLQAMIATAVSELAMNIVKYADRGYVTIAVISQMQQCGIEVIAEDHGPGLFDRVLALTDNMSTGNSLGIGLPGVKRLMDEFLMDSAEGLGTKIVTRKWIPKDANV
jgi:serine/threonine-protein kinase RsbT